MLVRRSREDDVSAIRALTAVAFAGVPHATAPLDDTDDPGEAALVVWLLQDPTAIEALSLVAVDDDGYLAGHVICSRGDVDGVPALGLGPISVRPDLHRSGVGSQLMHAVLSKATALGEPVVVLLGDPAYYARFGFGPASALGVLAPDPAWGDFFQAHALGGRAVPTGTFHYAEPFDRL